MINTSVLSREIAHISPFRESCRSVAKGIASIFCLCRHRNTSWPFQGLQRCWDCTRVRTYYIGERPGMWHREAR